MTTQESLKLLDDAVSHIQANRAVHAQIQEAVSVLTEAIKVGENASNADG